MDLIEAFDTVIAEFEGKKRLVSQRWEAEANKARDIKLRLYPDGTPEFENPGEMVEIPQELLEAEEEVARYEGYFEIASLILSNLRYERDNQAAREFAGLPRYSWPEPVTEEA